MKLRLVIKWDEDVHFQVEWAEYNESDYKRKQYCKEYGFTYSGGLETNILVVRTDRRNGTYYHGGIHSQRLDYKMNWKDGFM